MNKQQVIDNLGQRALFGDATVIIQEWEKGWVHIDQEGKTRKVRAKDLMPVVGGNEPEVDPKVADASFVDKPEEVEPEEVETEEKPPMIKGATMKDGILSCGCGKDTTIGEKVENIRCKGCGRMYRVRLHPDKERYHVGLGVTSSGRDTVDINDEVAAQLRGMAPDKLYDYAESLLNEMDLKCAFGKAMRGAYNKFDGDGIGDFLYNKYAHLNLGMQRMNIGNLLRGAYNRCSKSQEGEK